MKRGIAALFAMALTTVALAGNATAAYSPPHLYDCRERSANMPDPPPQPKLPPEIEETVAAARASEDLQPVCPAGQVPYPTGGNAMPQMYPTRRAEAGSETDRRAFQPETKARPSTARPARRGKGRRGGRKKAPRQFQFNRWYSWAVGWQEFAPSTKVNGFFVSQTNEQPYITPAENEAGAHSLGQLWATDYLGAGEACNSTVETGWVESLGQYGDVQPHLFVSGFDCGGPMGEPGKGLPWVQSHPWAFPGMVVNHNDVFHVYGARLDGNNWWLYYDGVWLGYIPNAAWQWHFPWVIDEVMAGGEVQTPNKWTCSDMGYAGLSGHHPWAAMFNATWYEYANSTKASSAWLTAWWSDTGAYEPGNWYAGHPGNQFRYGGTGWC